MSFASQQPGAQVVHGREVHMKVVVAGLQALTCKQASVCQQIVYALGMCTHLDVLPSDLRCLIMEVRPRHGMPACYRH